MSFKCCFPHCIYATDELQNLSYHERQCPWNITHEDNRDLRDDDVFMLDNNETDDMNNVPLVPEREGCIPTCSKSSIPVGTSQPYFWETVRAKYDFYTTPSVIQHKHV